MVFRNLSSSSEQATDSDDAITPGASGNYRDSFCKSLDCNNVISSSSQDGGFAKVSRKNYSVFPVSSF